LQIEDEKAPVGAFTIRCPKCRNLVKAKRDVPAPELNLTARQRPTGGLEKPKAAAQYLSPPPLSHNQIIDNARAVKAQPSGDTNQLLQALVALLQQGTAASGATNTPSFEWARQRALVCVEASQRETVARLLSEKNYQVYVAEDKMQAVERMREEKMNLIVLSPSFDEQNLGEGVVRQEIDFLRPADRRRLFVVLLTEHEKTLDSHAAFLEAVNVIVNTKEVEALPRALDISLLQYNELYHHFNNSLGIGPIG
jgi:CheY-like chemotaxis protein